MRIDVSETSNKGITMLTLTHGSESEMWNVNAYDRATFSDVHLIFQSINDFWASISQEKQGAIWKVYKAIYHTLTHSAEVTTMHVRLRKEVKQLYDLMPFEEVKHWVTFHGNIRMPATVKSEYGPSDIVDRTYLRKDYMDLAVLAIALRPMIPIWGEYIERTTDYHGAEFKEYMAAALLKESHIINSPPMIRLQTYVVSTVTFQEINHAAITEGLGTSETPDWVMARCLTRRIAVGEINAIDENASIISNVYKFINSTLKSMDRSFNGRINEKSQSTSNSDEDNSSTIEMYKVKQEFSDGDLVALNVYTENIEAMALLIEPAIDMARVMQCFEAIQALNTAPIKQHQIILAQWIMNPVIPCRGIPFLNKPALLRTLAVTQAVLWHWGFPELAALATVVEKPMNRDTMSGALESRGRIPKEIADVLQVAYPFFRRARSKDKSVRQLNVACKAIDLYCELVVNSDWQLVTVPALVSQVQRQGNTNRMIISADIRTHLGNLIKKLAERQ
jgi:hypothetical protein